MASARLMRGQDARDAVLQLLELAGDAIPTLAIDPEARRGGPLRVMAVAAGGDAVLVDMASTTDLAAWFADDRPFGAYDAKAVHAALLRAALPAPQRWACLRLSEQLLAGGDPSVSTHLRAIAERSDEAPPADPNDGLEAFAAHARSLERILRRQIPRLRDAGLARVSRIEAAAVAPVAAMEYRGMPFDAARWRALTRHARDEQQEKLVNTYGDSLLAHCGPDGRIRPSFEQIGASTGRMACHSPNLQAVVKDGPHRQCFRGTDDRRLVVADYATCELRILAEMSGDPVFVEAFERGEDVHARVASRIFNAPVSKTENPELRHRAKAVNFGLIYGMGAAGLARTIGVSLGQAQALLSNYFRTFPKIRTFLESAAADALAAGEARTLTGRVLYLQIDPGDRAARGHASRVAKNMPIQGTSADITKIALARVHRALRTIADTWLVNCVHDEIVVECPAEHADVVAKLVEEAMRLAGEEVLKRVPVAVDVAVQSSWQ